MIVSKVTLYEITSWLMTSMISLALHKTRRLLTKMCQSDSKSDSKIEFIQLRISSNKRLSGSTTLFGSKMNLVTTRVVFKRLKITSTKFSKFWRCSDLTFSMSLSSPNIKLLICCQSWTLIIFGKFSILTSNTVSLKFKRSKLRISSTKLRISVIRITTSRR